MLQAVSIAGIVLMLIGMADPRARALVALIALVWLETAISSSLLAGDHLWAARWGMRVPIDIVAGFMALQMTLKCETKDEGPPLWMLGAVSCFSLMLLAHGAFWMARFNGVDLWAIYPHTLNVLFLLQLACLAWPGGGLLIGRAVSRVRGLVSGWRGWSFVGAGEAARTDWGCETQTLQRRYRCADDGTCSGLSFSGKRT